MIQSYWIPSLILVHHIHFSASLTAQLSCSLVGLFRIPISQSQLEIRLFSSPIPSLRTLMTLTPCRCKINPGHLDPILDIRLVTTVPEVTGSRLPTSPISSDSKLSCQMTRRTWYSSWRPTPPPREPSKPALRTLALPLHRLADEFAPFPMPAAVWRIWTRGSTVSLLWFQNCKLGLKVLIRGQNVEWEIQAHTKQLSAPRRL